MTPWLDVIGIGEDGWEGLSNVARTRLRAADVIVGGSRHHDLAPDLTGQRLIWPSPFRDLACRLTEFRGRNVAVLVTGDPLWYSAGALFLRHFNAEEITFHPQLSAFQLAATRMKWSLADVETITVHGRPVEQATPFFAPGQRLLILAQDGDTPSNIGRLLTDNGMGASQLTVLAAMGGETEKVFTGSASGWDAAVPDFHVVAVACVAETGTRVLPRTGLPDNAFVHDGKMTKREVRALTLAALAPRRGQTLWDIGVGCGSVAIEWMRAARDMKAIGFDTSDARLAMAATNAIRLGAPRLDLRQGRAPDVLTDLSSPDAIFIGGGLSAETIDATFAALKPHGRLVANAVTLDSESVLAEAQARHGGDLVRLSVSHAEPVGRLRGWKPMMPVTQWSLTK